MKITRIKIENKFNLKHVDIKFHKDNALVVGPNGWGKTNIVRSVTEAVVGCKAQQFFSHEKIPAVRSFVRLWFTLTKNETWKILELRLIFVIKRMLELCGALAREKHRNEKPYSQCYVADEKIPEVIKFWNNVFPKLLGILAKVCDNLDEFISSKVEADVEVLHAYYSQIDFMGIQLPDTTKEEFKVITSAFTKIFGEDILDKFQAFPGMPIYEVGREKEVTEEEEEEEKAKQKPLEEDSVEGEDVGENSDDENITDVGMGTFNSESEAIRATISEHVENILDLKIFLRLAGFELHGVNNGIYVRGIDAGYSWFSTWIKYLKVRFEDHGDISENNTHSETIGMILEQLQGTDESRMWNTLGRVIETFLKDRPVCILSQNRDNVKQEEGTLFWNMGKAQKQFISASLSTGKETMLNKFEEAVTVIANLQLKTIQVPPGSNNLVVVFQNCGDKEWRNLDEASAGERELILVLAAIHLSDADSVFLDEPGHSLHPPKQAQLRRWLERNDNQVLFVITHSSDMVSSFWLDGLYHMYSDDEHFSSGSLRGVLSDESEASEPPRKKKKISGKINKPDLNPVLVEFLMGVGMRRLFFSSGTIFVEGDTDKRVIEMLRVVELDRLNQLNDSEKTQVRDMIRAYWDTQVDDWDIISIDGSANWLKAYQAAMNLKVPFLIVLDADVLNNRSGSSILPINYEDWTNSRLRKAVKNSGCLDDDAHPLAKVVKSIDRITQSKTEDTRRQEKLVREELKKCHLWVWNNGDIESVLFEDDALRNALLEKDSFKKAVEEIGISIPEESSKSHLDEGTLIKTTKNIHDCHGRFKKFYDEADNEFKQVVSQVEKNPRDFAGVDRLQSTISSNAGKVKQDLQNFKRLVKKLEKTEPGNERKMNTDDLFFELKKKLHDEGCWKTIPSESLQVWISKALEVKEDHPFHLLWEFIREKMKSMRKEPVLPRHIMEKFVYFNNKSFV